MIHHIVLFRMHPTTGPLQVEDARRALETMQGSIPEVRRVSFGPNLGPSAEEWPHVLVVQVDTMAAVERYLAHPVHVDTVAKYVAPIRAARMAIDVAVA